MFATEQDEGSVCVVDTPFTVTVQTVFVMAFARAAIVRTSRATKRFADVFILNLRASGASLVLIVRSGPVAIPREDGAPVMVLL